MDVPSIFDERWKQRYDGAAFVIFFGVDVVAVEENEIMNSAVDDKRCEKIRVSRKKMSETVERFNCRFFEGVGT